MYGAGVGRIGQFFPGTASHDLSADISQLTGQQIINLMGEMKRQSATGATGFGQLSDAEGQLLKNAATQLADRGISPQHAKEQLALAAQLVEKMLTSSGGGTSSGTDEWVTVK